MKSIEGGIECEVWGQHLLAASGFRAYGGLGFRAVAKSTGTTLDQPHNHGHRTDSDLGVVGTRAHVTCNGPYPWYTPCIPHTTQGPIRQNPLKNCKGPC